MPQNLQKTTMLQPGGFAWRKRLTEENARLRLDRERTRKIASLHALFMREGDHRIKNSLQIVASLIGRQIAREENPCARDALRAVAARVRSIASIHNALQNNEGKDFVDLGDVLGSMCRSLHEMAGDPQRMSVVVASEPIQAPVALAQPIVLAVNELVVNALRHAFPGNRRGTVHVSAARLGDRLRIVVADDGHGFPENPALGQGYGMELVRMMTAQVGGALSMDRDAGTRFTLAIPAP